MNCEKIRQLLLTDYLDAVADTTTRTKVQKHLESCSACRSFEEKARLAVGPFKNAPPAKLPESVWYAIKGKIAQRQEQKASLFDLIKEKFKILYSPRPAFAYVSAMLILLVVAGALAKYTLDKNQVRDYFAQQIGFYAMLDTDEENNGNFF